MSFHTAKMLILIVFCSMIIVPVIADEGYWRSRSIDNEREDLGSYCSLKIDAEDRAYIAYYSDTCNCLKLAWQPYSRGFGDRGDGTPFFAWSSLTKSRSTTGKGVSLWVNETNRTFAFSCVNDSHRLFLGEGAFRAAIRDGFAPYLTSLEDITIGYSIAGVPTSLIRWRETNGVFTEIAFSDGFIQDPGLGVVEIFPDGHAIRGGTYDGYRGDGHSAAYHDWSTYGVCYYNWMNGTLEYNNWRYGGEPEVVDGSRDSPAGAYCALAYDSYGNPHISYRNMTSGGLKYAFRNETGWHTFTIDSRRDAGLYTSIAIDSNNEPHISYSTISQLWYASVNGSTWYTQRVDRTPTQWTSIDVDSMNRPRIAYYDSQKHDLRFAWWEPNIRARPFPR